MANWHALFPNLDSAAAEKLKGDIMTEKLKAAAAFDDRYASLPHHEKERLDRKVATVVATGSQQSFGGHECGLPFMGDDWLEERRANPKPLIHDGVSVIVNDSHYFQKDWLWIVRGTATASDALRSRGGYARVRKLLEAQASPYGEAGIRLALLDEFPHLLQIVPIVRRGDHAAIRLEPPNVARLAVFGDWVEPEETCQEAVTRLCTNSSIYDPPLASEDAPRRTRSASALRFEPEVPAVTLVSQVEVSEMWMHRPPRPLEFHTTVWVELKEIFEARKGDCGKIIESFRRYGFDCPDDLTLNAADAEAFILTV
jgi:hypothetical protein